MICIHCETETSEDLCDACGESPLVDGEYQVLEVLGRGANATTYRAERIDDGEVVALKELLVRNAESLKTLELFEREARTLEQLDHPGIPEYFDELTVELGPNVGMYIAQEFVGGTSLDQRMKQGPMDPIRVLRVMHGVAEVLDYLDDLNPPVVHRDIKPANIIDRGGQRVALIDFGSVLDVTGDARTGVPTMAGTLGYMAPEQLMGRSTPASDVYGLAVTAVALLTGEPPGEDLLDSDWSWSGDLPDEVRQLLKRMLATRPTNRPAADALLEKVTDVLAAFDRERELADQKAEALARVPDVPRRIPANFQHGPKYGGRTLAATIGTAALILATVLAAVGAGNVGLAVLISGAILAAIPLFKAHKERSRVQLFTHGRAAIASVDGVVGEEASPRTLHYSFEVDGRTVHSRWSSTTARFLMDPGDLMLVFYDPENPSRNQPLFEYLENAPRVI